MQGAQHTASSLADHEPQLHSALRMLQRDRECWTLTMQIQKLGRLCRQCNAGAGSFRSLPALLLPFQLHGRGHPLDGGQPAHPAHSVSLAGVPISPAWEKAPVPRRNDDVLCTELAEIAVGQQGVSCYRRTAWRPGGLFDVSRSRSGRSCSPQTYPQHHSRAVAEARSWTMQEETRQVGKFPSLLSSSCLTASCMSLRPLPAAFLRHALFTCTV